MYRDGASALLRMPPAMTVRVIASGTFCDISGHRSSFLNTIGRKGIALCYYRK